MPSPADPAGGYVLDWEKAADRTVPANAPPGWAKEYNSNLVHTDGHYQVELHAWLRFIFRSWVRTRTKAAWIPDAIKRRIVTSLVRFPIVKPPRTRGGLWCVRFQLEKTDPVINSGTRAELTAGFEPVGAERWYGFSIYLPTDWQFDQAAEIVTQWHQHWDIGTSPPLAIQTHKGNWEISQNWEGPNGIIYANTPIGPYQTDRWTDWVVHVRWSAGANGLLEIWKDGQPVTGFSPKNGKNNYTDPAHGNYMKFGIYKWAWSQGKPSDTSRRVMFYDELRIADQTGTYGTVRPR
jgi:hypothetical protein